MRLARIAVFNAPGDVYACYSTEVLTQLGLPFTRLEPGFWKELPQYDILILNGYGELQPSEAEGLEAWVQGGGCVIAIGSVWGCAGLFGVTTSEGHPSRDILANPGQESEVWPESFDSIRFFGGVYVQSAIARDLVQTLSGHAALTERRAGTGAAILFAPHVGASLARMAMGRSVEADGIGPNDGSANLDDGTLRAEDGVALSFDLDRTTAPDGSRYFGVPHADGLRELLMRTLMRASDFLQAPIGFLWYWPLAAPGVAAVTVECEEASLENMVAYQRWFQVYGTAACWLVRQPGYPREAFRELRRWGHEIGLLFTCDEGTGWQAEKLKIQSVAVCRVSGSPHLRSVRPAQGRWKGYADFYQFCSQAGIRVSHCKGGRMPGTQGFAFGTSMPFMPQKRDGHPFGCFEVPYLICEPGLLATNDVIDAVVERTAAVSGCVTLAASSVSINNEQAATAMVRFLARTQLHSLLNLTPERIDHFLRARRNMKMEIVNEDDIHSLSLIADGDVTGLTVMFSHPDLEVMLKGQVVGSRQIERFGRVLTYVTLDLDSRTKRVLQVKAKAKAKLAA